MHARSTALTIFILLQFAVTVLFTLQGISLFQLFRAVLLCWAVYLRSSVVECQRIRVSAGRINWLALYVPLVTTF